MEHLFMKGNVFSKISKEEQGGVKWMAYTSRIANHLLVTPFDDKCAVSDAVSDKLTEEEFCKYCYSSPKFLQKP